MILSEAEYVNNLDTAMCIWEYIVEQLAAGQDRGETNRWEKYREFTGTATLREWAAQQVDTVNTAWEISVASRNDSADLHLCFDWDFVPAFLEAAYTDALELRPDWTKIAAEIRP